MSEWLNNRIFDDTWYGDHFDSREDAIKDGVEQYKKALNGDMTELFYDDYSHSSDPSSSIFYVGEAVPFVPYVNVDMIIEDIQMQADDEVGDIAEDFLDWNYLKQEWVDELEESLQREFDAWMKKHDLEPTFFSVGNTEEIDAEDYL